MSDLRRTLAFAFRRRGTETFKESDLRHLLSLDLRWFSPGGARRVVEAALARGLLLKEGDRVRPAFEVAAVDVPLNWRPGEGMLEESDGTDVLEDVLAMLRRTLPEDAAALERAVREEVARLEGLLVPEVAAVLSAARRGADVRGLVGRIEAGLVESPSP